MKAKGLVICIVIGVILSYINTEYWFERFLGYNATANSNAKLIYISVMSYLDNCTSLPADGAYCESLEKKFEGDSRFDGSSEDIHDHLCSLLNGTGYYYVYFKDGKPLQACWSKSRESAVRYGEALTKAIEGGTVSEQEWVYSAVRSVGGYPVYIIYRNMYYKIPTGAFVLDNDVRWIFSSIPYTILPLIITLAVYGAVCTVKRIKKERSKDRSAEKN